MLVDNWLTMFSSALHPDITVSLSESDHIKCHRVMLAAALSVNQNYMSESKGVSLVVSLVASVQYISS